MAYSIGFLDDAGELVCDMRLLHQQAISPHLVFADFMIAGVGMIPLL